MKLMYVCMYGLLPSYFRIYVFAFMYSILNSGRLIKDDVQLKSKHVLKYRSCKILITCTWWYKIRREYSLHPN